MIRNVVRASCLYRQVLLFCRLTIMLMEMFFKYNLLFFRKIFLENPAVSWYDSAREKI